MKIILGFNVNVNSLLVYGVTSNSQIAFTLYNLSISIGILIVIFSDFLSVNLGEFAADEFERRFLVLRLTNSNEIKLHQINELYSVLIIYVSSVTSSLLRRLLGRKIIGVSNYHVMSDL